MRGQFPGPVVGITGSNGKTSSKELVALALAEGLGRVHATEGNRNNHVGLPLTLLRAPPDIRAMVLEMGMNAPGEILTLASIARPTVRLITNASGLHACLPAALEPII